MCAFDFLAIDPVLRNALLEDIGAGDLTTESIVSPDLAATGDFVAKQNLILAGWPLVSRIFRLLSADMDVTSSRSDGELILVGETFGRAKGKAVDLLKAERVILNFLQHLSGIATLTRAFVDAVAGTRATILDTRKTTPGLRLLEKYAVRVAGARNHRFGLSDGVLIKENHITAGGGMMQAVRRARSGIDHIKKLEVEVTNFEELSLALEAGVDVVLLDNLRPQQVREAVQRVAGKVPLEVSGGVNLQNVREYAECGVDFISIGALRHSAKAADISLELRLQIPGLSG